MRDGRGFGQTDARGCDGEVTIGSGASSWSSRGFTSRKTCGCSTSFRSRRNAEHLVRAHPHQLEPRRRLDDSQPNPGSVPHIPVLWLVAARKAQEFARPDVALGIHEHALVGRFPGGNRQAIQKVPNVRPRVGPQPHLPVHGRLPLRSRQARFRESWQSASHLRSGRRGWNTPTRPQVPPPLHPVRSAPRRSSAPLWDSPRLREGNRVRGRESA